VRDTALGGAQDEREEAGRAFEARHPLVKSYEYLLIDLATYKEVARERQREGWRLMRISAPAVGAGVGWRLTFERDVGGAARVISVPFCRA
jgi:hypothetical protein